MSKFKQVEMFNREILKIKPRILGIQDEEEFRLSHHQMQEEVGEFLEACEHQDFIGAIDALIDNMVFTYGVAYKLGLDHDTFHKCFTAVMMANMEKKIGVKAGREGYNAVDAIKPEDWIAPEERIAEILNDKLSNS